MLYFEQDDAHRAGFDAVGYAQIGSVSKASLGYDANTWIGATDAAALLRFYNVDAAVYDFELSASTVAGTAAASKSKSESKESGSDSESKAATTHTALVDFAFCYFESRNGGVHAPFSSMREHFALAAAPSRSSGGNGSKGNGGAVRKTAPFVPPLYLQHQGHSRTVVGACIDTRTNERALVIVDPNMKFKTSYGATALYGKAAATTALRTKGGYHKFIFTAKQLRRHSYQIVRVARFGAMNTAERQAAKLIVGAAHY
jgi:hypothetical protein